MALITYDEIELGSPRDIVPINDRFNALKTQINGGLDASNLAADSVGQSELAENSVTTSELALDAVMNENIGSRQVTGDKMALGTVVLGNLHPDMIGPWTDSGWLSLDKYPWVTGSASYYRKIGAVVYVHLNITASNVSGSDVAVATLPAGFRPTVTSYFAALLSGVAGATRVYVDGVGTVAVWGVPAATKYYANFSFLVG